MHCAGCRDAAELTTRIKNHNASFRRNSGTVRFSRSLYIVHWLLVVGCRLQVYYRPLLFRYIFDPIPHPVFP